MNNSKEKEDDDILKYIQSLLSQKKTREEITTILKGMGWTDDDVNRRFLEMNMEKRKRKKKIIVNIAATIIIIIIIVFILLFSPKSPVKYQQAQTIKAAGEAQVYSEDIHDIIYDNETGQRNDIPVPFAEALARMKREEQERENAALMNRPSQK